MLPSHLYHFSSRIYIHPLNSFPPLLNHLHSSHHHNTPTALPFKSPTH